MLRLMRRFRAAKSGATVVEYAVLVGLLSIVIAAAITRLGTTLYNVVLTATTAIH